MRAEFYAPTRGGDRAVLQHADNHGERWLCIQPGTPVVFEDLVGTHPGCEPERIEGYVERVELRLLSPEPRLIVWLERGEATMRTPWGPSPMRAMQANTGDCWGEIDDRGDCRSCDYNGTDRPHQRERHKP